MRCFKVAVIFAIVCLSLTGRVRADEKIVYAAEKADKARSNPGARMIARKMLPQLARKISPQVEIALDVLEVVEIVDKATTTVEGVKLESKGEALVRQRTYFGVQYVKPNVTFSDSYTNTVLGRKIPGREVTITVTVDCDVDCRVFVDDITFTWNGDKKKLNLSVPAIEVEGRVPDGRDYDYRVKYGEARTRLLNRDDAKGHIKKMLPELGKKAAEEFKTGETFTSLQEGLQGELQKLIMTLCPKGTSVIVQFEEK